MCVRVGAKPQILASSTPKPGRLIAALSVRSDIVITTGSIYDNPHLSQMAVKALEQVYGGTRLGRQELDGELLDEVEGALVTPAMIHACRETPGIKPTRIVVGVDPSGSTTGDRQGIVVCGADENEAWVMADRSCSLSPEGWGRRVVDTALEFEADCIAVERNYGGDMARSTITQAARHRGSVVRVVDVQATRAKHVRFEPVAALLEQGRLHFPVDALGSLEDECCNFSALGYEGGGSPDRVDAMVWALHELILNKRGLSWADLYGGDTHAMA
jgi:phage terminase large subunit-like protein